MKSRISHKPVLLLLLLALSVLPLTAEKKTAVLSDGTIKTMVEHRLIKHKILHNDNIEVGVVDGVVTLAGDVRSVAERQRAQKAALGVDDVSRVQNNLVVSKANVSDQQIADEVTKKIRSFVFYDVFDWVEGSVEKSKVKLTGWVREPWRKLDYGRLVEEVFGVEAVDNQIHVLPLSSYDDQLRIAAARLIYGDPRLVRYANRSNPPIHIVVENGRVTLKGAVSSSLERQLIENQVRTGLLALEVSNELTVDSRKTQG